jgi:hypothetical protein
MVGQMKAVKAVVPQEVRLLWEVVQQPQQEAQQLVPQLVPQ